MTSFSLLSSSSSSSRCSSSPRIFSSKRRPDDAHLGKRRQRRLPRARSTDDNDDEKEKEQERNKNEDDDVYSVCVLGAGPAGLTTALAMQKMLLKGTTTTPKTLSKLKITVLDKNPNALDGNLGGGFNINGGAAVLEKLGVYEEVFSKNANALRAVLSRRCDIARTRLFEVDVEKEVRGDFLTNAKELLVNEKSGEVMAGTVMRADLSQSLRESLNEETCEVVLGCEVLGVDAESGEVELRRRDGTTTETRKFDLIVGADGIDSLARKCVVESNASSGDGSSSGSGNSSRSGGSSTSGRKEPIYSGIKILFGVTGVDDKPEDLIRELSDRTTAHQWFGDGAYSLVFTGGGENKKRHNLAFCSNEPLGSANSNPSWRANSSVTKEYAHNKMMKANMPADVLRLCLRCERFFEIGVFFHEPLDSWSSSNGKVVLVGDAAHAMPPFLGQGANQAMQDAYVLAKCLATCGADIKNPSKVNEALQSYSNTRRPPTEAIMNASRFVGALETGKGPVSLFRDLAFFVAGKFGITGKIFLSGATPRL